VLNTICYSLQILVDLGLEDFVQDMNLYIEHQLLPGIGESGAGAGLQGSGGPDKAANECVTMVTQQLQRPDILVCFIS
jgi:hypothetical protein